MTTITPENGSNPAYSGRSYSGLSNKLVKAANSVDYAYRDTGPAAGDGVPLVLLQHFVTTCAHTPSEPTSTRR